MSTANMDLLVIDKNTCFDGECAICYKPIGKYFFQCSAPCSKIFHVTCIEKMMEQTNNTATVEEPQHKCCYCRRQIDTDRCFLYLLKRQLLTLKASGCYDVLDALYQVNLQIKNNTSDEDISYDIYNLRDVSFFKKPKQTNRVIQSAKPNGRQQNRRNRIAILSGRRR